MSNTLSDNPIPSSIQTLLEIFESELASVKFPDVDKKVLDAAAEVVKARAEEVARAEATLDAARAALLESQDGLLQKGQRALAYARIFAEENPELSARLDTVQLPRGKKANRTELPSAASSEDGELLGPPKRRGRPAKQKGAPLFAEDGTQINGEQHAAAEQV